ncbi:MAG TPA: DegT/DnrJ/EryC1/StrS family aminotransferase [Candidatus Hydrogenedentes bacterium]|nr:DegT/DnrJ/EryC1/StrS family aminotransferase [Candidatus Hydrogenedentota bacterium]
MSSPKIRHDLVIQFGNIYGPEEEQAVLDTLRRHAPTSGESCAQFEQAFADYCGVQHARCVTNGTAALFLSMVGLGIKPGDRVITTPLTWIATAAAAATLGADIDFVDVEPDTWNINPQLIEAKITPQTRAIVPVHLYGQPCDMDAIVKVAEKHGLAVVEDACHAVGASWRGRKTGSLGAVGCFSFHEQKNMSTLGEGGMITTNDPDLFERIALYRSHCTRVYGKSTKYCSLDETVLPMGKRFWWQDFDDVGYNFRMTDIQAAVGLTQLRKLDSMNRRRIVIAARYTEGLSGIPGLRLPQVRPDRTHVFHLYPVVLEPEKHGVTKEDFVYRMLHEYGIRVGTHYIPLTWSTAFRKRGYAPGQFPVADTARERLVTLPIHPRLTEEAIDYLISSVHELLG